MWQPRRGSNWEGSKSSLSWVLTALDAECPSSLTVRVGCELVVTLFGSTRSTLHRPALGMR